jgi:hypothetical protein
MLSVSRCCIENVEGAIKNGQSRESGNIQDEDKQEHNTLCVGHHYAQANTNYLIKTWALPQITAGKDERKIVFMRKS